MVSFGGGDHQFNRELTNGTCLRRPYGCELFDVKDVMLLKEKLLALLPLLINYFIILIIKILT